MGIVRPTAANEQGPSVMDQLQGMYDMREKDQDSRMADLAYKKVANPGPSAAEMYDRRLKEREIMMDWTPTQVEGSWAKGRIAQDTANQARLDAYRAGDKEVDAAREANAGTLAAAGKRGESRRDAYDQRYGLDLAKFVAETERNTRKDAREAATDDVRRRKDIFDMTTDYLTQSRTNGYLSSLPVAAAPLVESAVQELASMVGDPRMAEAMIREQLEGLQARDMNGVPFETRPAEEQKALIADAIAEAKKGIRQ
jgi:hypothetical protein